MTRPDLTIDEFQRRLGALLLDVRRAATLDLEEIIAVLSAELDGLEMAQGEGEEF